MKNKNLVVVKHNKLIEARYKLDLIEQRVVLACAAKIVNGKPMPDSLVLTAEEYVEFFKSDMSNAYKHLQMAAKKLKKRTVIIQDDSNVEHSAIWVSESKYFKKEGRVELWFSPSIRRYLSEISANFTRYDFKAITKINSNYAIRLYESITRFNDTGWWEISLHDLRWQLGLEEGMYSQFYNFKHRVLDGAVNELNKSTNLVINYNTIPDPNDKRKVAKIKFTFHEASQQKLPLE